MTQKEIPLCDCRGLVCPMPIIEVRLKLNTMQKDEYLVILADDETFDSEFHRFCPLADITLIEKKDYGEFQSFLIQLDT